MGNTFKTTGDGDINRVALASFHNNLKFIKTINRQFDSRFSQTGAKNGGTLLIREPNQFTVRTGAVMDVQDITETTQSLTVAIQKGVDMNFSSIEATMSMDDVEERYLKPAMSRLAADVEYTVLAGVYKNLFLMSGTPATTPASMTAALNAGVKLSQNLAPETDRYILYDSPSMAASVAAMGVYFHKASEQERMFSKGYVGEAANFKWMESNMIPNHTNGTRTDATPITTIGGTVSTPTGGIVNGTASIVTTGQTNGQTVKAGDIFTISDVYAVNPETKQVYSHLKQWVITADLTCDATDTFAVSPTPYASGAKQNCSIASTGAKTIVHVAAGGSGAASAVYPQCLAYHKDAFTFVSADLYKDPGARMTSNVIDGISMRLWRGTDIINDKFPTRFDVLFSYKTIRPEHAVRTRG